MRYNNLRMVFFFFVMIQDRPIVAEGLTDEQIRFHAVTTGVCRSVKTNSARRQSLAKEFAFFSNYTDSQIDEFCREQLALAADIKKLVNEHEIVFEPISIENLSDWISQFPTKSKAIKEVEKDFHLSSSTCGRTANGSRINKALYALLVIGENKKDVENAIYYYQRCLLIANQRFSDGLEILIATAEKSFKTAADQIDEIRIRAYFDHLTSSDENGQSLHKLERDRAIEILLRYYLVSNKKYESEVSEFVEEFIGTSALKPYLKLIYQFDRALFKRVAAKL